MFNESATEKKDKREIDSNETRKTEKAKARNTKERGKKDNDMFTKNTRKSTGLAAAALLALLVVGNSTTASAQRYERDGRFGRYEQFDKNEVKSIARRNGYEMGVREGRSDSYRGGRFDMKNSRMYRDGMAGYRYEFRHERDYRNAFRDGFESGYRSGFNSNQRRGGWGNGGSGNGGWGGNVPWGNRRTNFLFPNRF